MRQLLQNVSTGEITVDEVPAPRARPRARCSSRPASRVISAGTERAVARDRARLARGQGARAPGPGQEGRRVRARPRASRRRYAKVRGRLGEPNALGYCLSGDGARGVRRTRPPGRASSSPAPAPGIASHAEVVAVPRQPLRPRARGRRAARTPPTRPSPRSRCTASAWPASASGDVAAVVGLGLVGQLTLELLARRGLRRARRRPRPSDRAELARDGRLLRHDRPGGARDARPRG